MARQLSLHFGEDKLEFLRALLAQRMAEALQRKTQLRIFSWLEAQPFQGPEWSCLAEQLDGHRRLFFFPELRSFPSPH